MKKKKIIGAFIFLALLFNSCDGNNEPADLTRNTIGRESELFDLIQSVLERGDYPVENTICIDFVYPFKLFIYDTAYHPQGTVTLYSDDQFSQFLGSLDPDLSISISYPIQTSYPDGSIFSVNNDQQLKLALDSCKRDDIILHCNGVLSSQQTCVWKMNYSANQNSEFAESVFSANTDGTITFHHRDTDYLGTWVFLFINNSLYLNINLEGTSEVAQQWNQNYLVTMLYQGDLQLTSSNSVRNFRKICSSNSTYEIGQTGPNGGIIAYDKGQYTNGWRYIEVSTNDLTIEEWGCNESPIELTDYDGIGTGYQNTIANVQFHNNLINYYNNPLICSTSSNGTVSAKTALEQTLNPNDWFIPSIDELKAVYDNLHLLNLGDFENTNYWSSTEFNTFKAKCIDFTDGEPVNLPKNNSLVKTRLIRYF